MKYGKEMMIISAEIPKFIKYSSKLYAQLGIESFAMFKKVIAREELFPDPSPLTKIALEKIRNILEIKIKSIKGTKTDRERANVFLDDICLIKIS